MTISGKEFPNKKSDFPQLYVGHSQRVTSQGFCEQAPATPPRNTMESLTGQPPPRNKYLPCGCFAFLKAWKESRSEPCPGKLHGSPKTVKQLILFRVKQLWKK